MRDLHEIIVGDYKEQLMDIERATELCRAIDDKFDHDVRPLVYDYEAWDEEGDVPLLPGVTEQDAAHILAATTDFGTVTVEPLTTYSNLGNKNQEPGAEQWVDPASGRVMGYIPSKLKTRGLAQARKHLLAVEDVPPDLRRQLDETLDLIHEALVTLDYTPESPLLKLAAED